MSSWYHRALHSVAQEHLCACVWKLAETHPGRRYLPAAPLNPQTAPDSDCGPPAIQIHRPRSPPAAFETAQNLPAAQVHPKEESASRTLFPYPPAKLSADCASADSTRSNRTTSSKTKGCSPAEGSRACPVYPGAVAHPAPGSCVAYRPNHVEVGKQASFPILTKASELCLVERRIRHAKPGASGSVFGIGSNGNHGSSASSPCAG